MLKAPAFDDPEHLLAQAARSRDWCLKLTTALLHELSQPLTALQGEADLALAAAPGPCRPALEAFGVELDRLSELVRRFRELVELERLAEPASAVGLAGLVRGAVELLTPLADARSVTLQLVAEGEAIVRAAPGPLERAIQKLIHRAIARSPDGGTIRLRVATRDGALTLEIIDQGPPAAFSESTRRLDVPGSGLEWAYASRLAESSGGWFRAESVPGRGSVVSLSLPPSAESPP